MTDFLNAIDDFMDLNDGGETGYTNPEYYKGSIELLYNLCPEQDIDDKVRITHALIFYHDDWFDRTITPDTFR